MSEFADFDDYQDSAAADQDLYDRQHTDDEEAARSLHRAGRPVTRPANPWE